METSEYYERLRQRQQEEIDSVNEAIGQFDTFKKDYISLRDRVEVIGQKTHHEVMVPIGGKLAFMPGHIHHTNEFLVMIGCDHFVEKSAKETVEFVDRKLALCDETIEELEANKQRMNEWLKASIETRDTVKEIPEFVHEETDEEYQQWIKNHEKIVRDKTLQDSEDGEKMDIMKFLDNYKDDEDDEELDSDDDVPPVKLMKKPALIGAPKVSEEKAEEAPTPNEPLNLTELVSSLPTVIEHFTPPPSNPTQQEPVSDVPPRPISRFKASRMKQMNKK